MKNYFIILFFLIIQISFGQTNKITKKQLYENFNKKDSFARQWITCNTDSTFYKSDTLYFHDRLNFYRCKKYIIWGFDNSKAFYQVEGENFSNYDGVKLITKNDWYKIKIIEDENQLLINVFKQKKKVATFIVYELGYDEKERWNRLILIRK
jgi:hypothetical protein